MPFALLYVLFFVSGAAGLVYELVWVRQLVLVFGGTTYAITTVLVAFMGGLGLGSFLAGRLAPRLSRPGPIYGLLEVAIGAYALCIPWLLTLVEPAYRAAYPYLAHHPALLTLFRFAISASILLVPTTCMGATLPVLVRYVAAWRPAPGGGVAMLYGLNTLGAVAGVLLAGFYLLPVCGLTVATRVAAAGNFSVGVLALLLLRGVVARPTGQTTALRVSCETPPVGLSVSLQGLLLGGLAVSGLAAMVYQITWTRALIMSVGSSTYAFTSILAAFILGLALGSLMVAGRVDRWRRPLLICAVLELVLAVVAAAIAPTYGRLPGVVSTLVERYHADYTVLWGWQFVVITVVTLVPTLAMGALFPLVVQTLAGGRGDTAGATGRAYAVNTLGNIIGAFLGGFVLIRSDVLGVQNSIFLACLLNALVGLTWLVAGVGPARSSRHWAMGVGLAATAWILAVRVTGGRWDLAALTSGPYLHRGASADKRVIYYADGADLTVAVRQSRHDPDALTLTVNGKPDASTGVEDMITQLLLGHVPALLSPAGNDVCVIGLGSGMTLHALACYPHCRRLDCVELSAEVLAAVAYFKPFIADVLDDPRVRLIRNDGRNHLLLADQQYDLIVSEPSNPWLAGVANLFTREFFALCRQRLRTGGRLALWMQGYSLSVDDFRLIVRTLFSVFPQVALWELSEHDYLLLASSERSLVGLDELLRRFALPRVRTDLWRIGIWQPAGLLGHFITADQPLRRWAGAGRLHTDDNTSLEFTAPLSLYRGQERELLRELTTLQVSVFDTLWADANPDPALREAALVAAATRLARVAAYEKLAEGDWAAALRLLLDGYAGDPTHIPTYSTLAACVRRAREQREQSADTAGLAELVLAIEALPPPLYTPARVTSPEELPRALLALGHQASDRRDWLRAARCYESALEVGPRQPQTMLGLAFALMQAGLTNQARAWLDELLSLDAQNGKAAYLRAVVALGEGDHEAALRLLGVTVQTGTFSAAELAADPLLEDLREDARFQRMLCSTTGTPPTQPAGINDGAP